MQVCVKGVISQEKLYGCICGAVMSKEALSVEYFGYRRLGLSRTMRGVLEFSSLLDDLNSSGQQFGSWGEASETMDIAEAQGLKQLSWTSRNYPSLKTLTLSIVSRPFLLIPSWRKPHYVFQVPLKYSHTSCFYNKRYDFSRRNGRSDCAFSLEGRGLG
jgi:hypothetical protein